MKRFGFLFLLSIFVHAAPAQNVLEIEISGIRNANGEILIQLYNQKHEVVSQKKEAIDGNRCNVKFEDLKPGKYAIRYFHDENLSQKLEISKIGIPKEGFGYSNNAAGRFGPPSFEKWLFDLTGNTKLGLKITYL
jgi:uncharacterized protein (DUF2141 family)